VSNNDEKINELVEEHEGNLENIENYKEEILNFKEKFEVLKQVTKDKVINCEKGARDSINQIWTLRLEQEEKEIIKTEN